MCPGFSGVTPLSARAKTVAQSLVAVFGAGAFNLPHGQLERRAGHALMTGALSVLTSIISAPIGPADSPSLVPGPVVYRNEHEKGECRGSSDSGRHRAAPGDLQPDSAAHNYPLLAVSVILLAVALLASSSSLSFR